jgi:hypothetical protein
MLRLHVEGLCGGFMFVLRSHVGDSCWGLMLRTHGDDLRIYVDGGC